MPVDFQQVLDFAREGFAEVNAFQGIIIAVAAALLLRDWGRLVFVVIFATAAHIALDVLAPVFAESGPLVLPPVLEAYYWRYVGLLLAGYLIVIGLLFAVKKVVTKN